MFVNSDTHSEIGAVQYDIINEESKSTHSVKPLSDHHMGLLSHGPPALQRKTETFDRLNSLNFTVSRRRATS